MVIPFKLQISKRQKIISTAILLSLGLFSTQLVPLYLLYRFIAGLTLLALVLSLWALRDGITKLKAVMLMILPATFTLAVSSYYLLLPVNWFIRVPVAIIFGLIFYTLLLSQNVFNIASVRTIPLYRVASTTVFVLTLFTVFLLSNVIFSINLQFYWNFLACFLLSFPLALHLIWSIEMEELSVSLIFYALVISLIVGEVAIVLSFWPISKSMESLLVTTALYMVSGIVIHQLRERLNSSLFWEYIGLGSIIFLIVLISTSWTG